MENIKKIFISILFLVGIMFFPFYVIIPLLTKDGFWALLYLLISPLFFIIVYKKFNINNKSDKIKVVIYGFIIPLILIYMFFTFYFVSTFKPSF
jgi:hypothetical protein